MDMEEDSSNSCNFLKDPLSINNLLARGSTFEINTNFNDELENEMNEELNLCDNDEDEKNLIDNELLVSPWSKSFKELKLEMEQLNEHIHKRVVRKGDLSSGLVPNKARVNICYNAYWEYQTAPFDSSYLRGRAFNFYTGCKQVLEGLEAAVRTMHSGEESQFLISYHLLFHELGCPPRIKPRADGLFVIKVESFNLVGDLYADEQLKEHELNKFSVVVEKVKEIHLKGLDFFSQQQYKNASCAFEKCINTLKYCHVANKEEELEHTEFMLKLYTNLTVLYNKLKLPGKVCVLCKEIRRLTNDQPSCKALFQEGRALIAMGEYSRARVVLQRATLLEPQNKELNKELKLLDFRYAKYKEDEKNIWTKALGIVKKQENLNNENEQNDEFQNEMIEVMESFKKNLTISTFKLPMGLTKDEIQTIDKLTKKFDLCLQKNVLEKGEYILTRK